MKKYLVLFISILVLGFASCSSDDDSSAPSVLGKWNFEKFEYYNSDNELLETEEVEYDCETNKVYYLDFKENKELDVVYYTSSCVERKYTSQWELQNQKVVFSLDGEFESTELTNSKLVLKTVGSSSGNYSLLYLTR